MSANQLSIMTYSHAAEMLVRVVRELAAEKRGELEEGKKAVRDLEREDFVWHYLLQSFATMGNSRGLKGLIEDNENYDRVTYPTLELLSAEERRKRVVEVCCAAKIRMPRKKAEFILDCFDRVSRLGGPLKAKELLLALPGRDEKIRFLREFSGIGEKYSRNMMMDVYHEDFRDSIAIDGRIKKVTERLGLSFGTYREHEAFYLDVARKAGVSGWELDRLLYHCFDVVEKRLDDVLECRPVDYR